MKAIIAGGRDYQFTADDIAWLDQIHAKHPITEVVSGGADGADACGEKWAKAKGIPIQKFEADWTRYGNSAGPIRNKEMADYADACILFPGGRGTRSMKYFATQKRMRIWQTTESNRWEFKPEDAW